MVVNLMLRLRAKTMPPMSRSRRKFTSPEVVADPPQVFEALTQSALSVKKHAKDQGGKIEHEYKIIKGFSYVQ